MIYPEHLRNDTSYTEYYLDSVKQLYHHLPKMYLFNLTRTLFTSSMLLQGYLLALIPVLGYLIYKLLQTLEFLEKLRKLPQLKSDPVFGHTKGLLPPPFTTSLQFGKGISIIIDSVTDSTSFIAEIRLLIARIHFTEAFGVIY